MGVERSGGLERAFELDFVVCDACAAGVVEVGGCEDALLGFDDFVIDARVDGRGWDVGAVAAVAAEGGDEVGVVLLL